LIESFSELHEEITALYTKSSVILIITIIHYLRINNLIMVVERTENEIIIRLSSAVKVEDLQAFLNYARYKELTANTKVDQEVVDQLADEINKTWWQENRDKLIK